MKICACKNRAIRFTVVKTGVCIVYTGWKGVLCGQPCDQGKYGQDCGQACECVHGTCDHVTGACSCQDGYQGVKCDQNCDVSALAYYRLTLNIHISSPYMIRVGGNKFLYLGYHPGYHPNPYMYIYISSLYMIRGGVNTSFCLGCHPNPYMYISIHDKG